MEQRLDYPKLAPDAARAMYGLGTYLAGCGLEHALLELVKIRASQINGCAFCIDMHTKDARAAGETEQRIYAISAWRETPSSPSAASSPGVGRSCPRIGGGVPDDLYAETKKHSSFCDGAGGQTWAVAAINAWNRVAISFRSVPGTYQPKRPHT